MTFGPAVGNVGMYVAREMLVSVPEDQRQAYLRMVEEISDLKYQLGVEVARQLPRLLAEARPRAGRPLPAPGQGGRRDRLEERRRGRQAASRTSTTPPTRPSPAPTSTSSRRPPRGPPEDTETTQLATELDDLERELREMEPKVKRAQELRTQLAARDRRDEKRRKHAVELAAALPPILARLRPRYRPPYLDQVRQVAAADPEASLEAADTLLDLLNGERVSPEGAAEWVTAASRCSSATRRSGAATSGSAPSTRLQVLEELKEGLALKSVARVLKLYATALSGHEVAIRATNELQAVDAYGADHIVLPPEMHFFEDDAGNFTAYKVATAHGAGRIEFGTYAFSLPTSPRPSPRLRARYPQEIR